MFGWDAHRSFALVAWHVNFHVCVYTCVPEVLLGLRGYYQIRWLQSDNQLALVQNMCKYPRAHRRGALVWRRRAANPRAAAPAPPYATASSLTCAGCTGRPPAMARGLRGRPLPIRCRCGGRGLAFPRASTPPVLYHWTCPARTCSPLRRQVHARLAHALRCRAPQPTPHARSHGRRKAPTDGARRHSGNEVTRCCGSGSVAFATTEYLRHSVFQHVSINHQYPNNFHFSTSQQHWSYSIMFP